MNPEWFSKVPVSCCGRCLYNVLLFSQVSSHPVHWESLQCPTAKENCSVPERNIPRQTRPVIDRHGRDKAASKPSKLERQNPSEGKCPRNATRSTRDLLSPSSLKDQKWVYQENNRVSNTVKGEGLSRLVHAPCSNLFIVMPLEKAYYWLNMYFGVCFYEARTSVLWAKCWMF